MTTNMYQAFVICQTLGYAFEVLYSFKGKQPSVLVPFHVFTMGNRGTENLCNLLKVMQLELAEPGCESKLSDFKDFALSSCAVVICPPLTVEE